MASEHDRIELAVVMPVYNERQLVEGTIDSWFALLASTAVDYRILVLDDGSTDGTTEVLQDLTLRNDRLSLRVKVNEGHGATVLAGYREAVTLADWVFQVDSDDEIPASEFTQLWAARSEVDAVLGFRTGRGQGAARLLVTRVARLSVRALFGKKVRDANCPFRLMRSSALAPLLARMPREMFAPNVPITGALAARGSFIELPVAHRERAAGESSLVGVGMLLQAATAARQTLAGALRLRFPMTLAARVSPSQVGHRQRAGR